MRITLLVGLPAALLTFGSLSSCDGPGDVPGAGPSIESDVAPPVASVEQPRTLEEIVADPAARLADARAERTATGVRVTTAWVIDTPRRHDPGVSEGARAYVMGGDGSTLLSFERVARSTDGGESWDLFDVPRVAGALPYIAQAAVLEDGRLLAPVPGWSNETLRRPGPNHHGLWVSDGADWGSYAPVEPAYSPPLVPQPKGFAAVESLGAARTRAGGVLWSVTWDGRLYASTDDGATFTEIAAR